MSRIKEFIEKDHIIYYILVILFLFSVILRTGLGIICGQMNVFYDELLHWNLSKSIYYHLGSNFRNDILSYKEILYSIVISISHSFGNAQTQYHVAVGINSVLMSSVIFPVYFMSDKFLNSKYRSLIIAFISIMVPEMYYTTKILQENLYYPMVIWFFYIFIVLILKNQYKIRNIILLSSYIFLVSLCKQMALNIFAGVVLYYILQYLFFDKRNRKKCLISLLFFITVFLGLKFTYDHLFNIINDITKESSSETTIIAIMKNIMDSYLLSRLIFPVLSYLLLTTLYFGYFTVTLPLSMGNELNKKERNLFLLTGTILISTIMVICLRIVPAENLDQIATRFHFRYMFYLIVPLLIVLFSIYDKVKRFKFNFKIVFLSAVYVLLLGHISIMPAEGSTIDCVGANYIKYLFNSDMMVNTLHMLIIIGISIGIYLIYRKKIKWFYSIIVIGLLLSGVISNLYTYIYIHNDKQDSVNKNEDALTMNKFLDEQPDFDWRSLLIISDKNVSDAKLETFLKRPDYYYSKTEDFSKYLKEHQDESFWDLNLYSFNHLFHDPAIDYPQFIITNKWFTIEGYDKVDIGLKRYYLYARNADE
ncbi:MAG: hypothetical protein WCD89_17190 [Anaerocolumna sp.]